jgi:hypothetical protein
MMFGLIPYFVQFPYNNSANSGPTNFWELLIYISYDGRDLFLSIGIIMFLISLILLYKIQKKAECH